MSAFHNAATLMLRFMADKLKGIEMSSSQKKIISTFTENIIMIDLEKVSEKRI